MIKWLMTRNPAALLQLALIALVLGYVSGGWMAWTVQGWRLDAVNANHAEFVAEVRAEGAAAEATAKVTEERYKQTLKEINDVWNSKLPKVRDNAVRAYLAAHSVSTGGSGSCQVSTTTDSPQSSNATGKECVPDERFIQDASEDALIIQQWQDWATGNNLPIEP